MTIDIHVRSGHTHRNHGLVHLRRRRISPPPLPPPAPPPPPGQVLQLRRPRTVLTADFACIARIQILSAEMEFKDRWLACISLGEQTFRTHTSDCDLVEAFGYQLAVTKKSELFKAADKNGDGVVSMDELADLQAFEQEEMRLC